MTAAHSTPPGTVSAEATATMVAAQESPIHGVGVFAVAEIEAHTLIGTYLGAPTSVDGTYVLWIESDDPNGWRGIDGHGILRHLNHSCTPNVEFDSAELYALRDIEPGEELLFDYGEEWANIP
jgi:SET domain-containing protein